MFKLFKISAEVIGFIFILSVALLLLFAYISSFSESEKSIVLFANMVIPYIYALNMVVFLILIAKFSFIKSLIPLSVLILTFNTATAMYGVNFFKRYDNIKPQFKVMTYNVHGFRDQQWIFKFDSMINEIDSINPDILFLQEFQTYNIPLKTIKERLPKLKYAHFHLSDSTSTKQEIGSGNIILSKYPLFNQRNLDFDESVNRAIVSNLAINDDTLTVINTHLQSSGIDITDRNKLQNIERELSILVKDSTVYDSTLMPIYDKLVNNNKKRKIQTDILAKFVEESKYPVILCGDFNSVPSSYAYRTFTSDQNMKDPFKKFGEGYGSTFKMFNNLLRIDYILHSEQYTSTSFEIPKLKFSDHYPVVVEFSKNKN